MLQEAEEVRQTLLNLVEDDAAVFNSFMACYKLPKATDAEKAARKEAMQSALKGCTVSPFTMMELACEALELVRSLVGKTNASAASDLGCAALNLRSAI